MKHFFLFLFASIVLFSCTTEVSDRIYPMEKERGVVEVDTFDVYKTVRIDLEMNKYFDYGDSRIKILVNSSDVVFYGTYSELIQSKIPLPKPDAHSLNYSGYLIGVTIYDDRNKLEYKWASDATNYLSDKKRNVIQLLYTGIEYESITLDVIQVD